MVNEWKPSIVTHLVMDALTFTIKVSKLTWHWIEFQKKLGAVSVGN